MWLILLSTNTSNLKYLGTASNERSGDDINLFLSLVFSMLTYSHFSIVSNLRKICKTLSLLPFQPRSKYPISPHSHYMIHIACPSANILEYSTGFRLPILTVVFHRWEPLLEQYPRHQTSTIVYLIIPAWT